MLFAIYLELLPRNPGGETRPSLHNEIFTTKEQAEARIKDFRWQNLPIKNFRVMQLIQEPSDA